MAALDTASGDLVSPLSVVSTYWREFNLEGMRTKLDEVGLKIAELQEESMQKRRKLADSTKDFKRTAPEGVKGVGPLLKQYQEEIDRLTKRAKNGESAFLELYQKLYEAPDPAPALALAFETASRATDLEAQCKRMAQELAEYKAESAQIRNQDLTVRKLEEKVRGLEAALEERAQEVAEAKERAVAEADAARMEQMQLREEQLTSMLAQAQASLAAMQKLYTATQNQLFAIQNQTEEEKWGRQSELELASAELERAQQRLTALEKEKEQLVQQLAPSSGQDGAGVATGGLRPSNGLRPTSSVAAVAAAHQASLEDSLRQELFTQRELAGRLRLELNAAKRDLEEANTMWEARVEGLRATLAATEAHSAAVEAELRARPSVAQMEDLRQQLRVLHEALGYSAMDADDATHPVSAAATTTSGTSPSSGIGNTSTGAGGGLGSSGSLEAILMAKNRHLEHELTMARLRVVDTKQELDAAAAQVAELTQQLASRDALVSQLEEDLLASRRAASASAGAAGGTAAGSGKGNLPGLLRGDSDDLGGDGDAGTNDAEGSGHGGESSMVRVLCAQRDRFRQRCHDLEEELNRAHGELAAARSECAAAKQDNLALIERLRYVHYKASSGKGGGAERDVEAAQRGAEVEKRYSRLYDEGLNPFKEFQGQQQERQRKAMGFADKAMYLFGQLVFGSQSARLFAFCYLSIMHLLVFASLARMTHHSSGQLYEHTQTMLDNRHDLTATMHHEGDASRLP